MHITIDTREQTPWHFEPSDTDVSRGTLQQGDYAIKGDSQFAIERKSMEDFLGTISTGWERFIRELGRMDAAGFIAMPIVVEGDFETVCFSEVDGVIKPPQHRRYSLSPSFVCKRTAELTMFGCSVLFVSNPGYAAVMALALFRLREAMINADEDPEQAKRKFKYFLRNLK